MAIGPMLMSDLGPWPTVGGYASRGLGRYRAEMAISCHRDAAHGKHGLAKSEDLSLLCLRPCSVFVSPRSPLRQSLW